MKRTSVFWIMLLIIAVLTISLKRPNDLSPQAAADTKILAPYQAFGSCVPAAGVEVKWKRIPLSRPESNWHVRIVSLSGDTVQSWDFTNSQLDAAATFSDTCQSLTFDTANNGHFWTPPATLPHNDYLIQFIDAATPAVTDQPVLKLIHWDLGTRTITWIGDL